MSDLKIFHCTATKPGHYAVSELASNIYILFVFS